MRSGKTDITGQYKGEIHQREVTTEVTRDVNLYERKCNKENKKGRSSCSLSRTEVRVRKKGQQLRTQN